MLLFVSSRPANWLGFGLTKEDRGLDTGKFAIAYLDRTITLGLTVYSQPRPDLIIYPASVVRIPVVRLETAFEAVLDEEARRQAVRVMLPSDLKNRRR